MTLYVVESHHEDIIHDAKLDYYSEKLATCSSDSTVRISKVNASIIDKKSPEITLIDVLKGHTGPVWQVNWAHPKFGAILASCSYDGKVCIWKENSQSQWEMIKEHDVHKSSVNAISWAPEDAGLILACGSSDGYISILSFRDNEWYSNAFFAHQTGCTTIAWKPLLDDIYANPDRFMNDTFETTESNSLMNHLRLVSGGCDHLIKLWRYDILNHQWTQDGSNLQGHTDWIRDISFSPTTIGLPMSIFASGGQDKRVLIWTSMQSDENSDSVYTCTAQLPPITNENDENALFSDVVWKVNWSPMGLVLAVSYGDNRVSLWKEDVQGIWECVQDIQDGETNITAQ